MWIDGKWVNSVSGKTYTAVNPAGGEVIAQIPSGDKADVDLAVGAARKAFPAWSGKTQAERSRIVYRLSELIRANRESLAAAETLDHGTPTRLANNFDVPNSAACFEYYAQTSRALMGNTLPVGPHTLSYIQREPVGVCALITPWNFPLMMVAWKLGAALAVGNTCIVKPPSIDSLSSLKLAELVEQLDLPPGTVNFITGPGASTGEELAGHPGVAKVGFTGSCEVGKQVMKCASNSVKRVGLELGGKNPFIVLKDADIEAAVEGAVFASFFNSGMVCAAVGRYYVHAAVYDEFVSKFTEAAQKVVVGDPADAKTAMGPLVSREQQHKVEEYIRSGLQEGAKMVLGGKVPENLSRGFYVMPTIFCDVTQDMTIAREEIFGPVACILKYSSEDEVINLANDSSFGLAASVWTKNTAKAIRFANALKAGFVWINDHLIIWPEQPWGGFKESGIGKDNSIYVFDEYTQLKTVSIDLTEARKKPWYSDICP
jgi:acyl-CoA reductase-like NAD-dependent aldehyde dehydrogenase